MAKKWNLFINPLLLLAAVWVFVPAFAVAENVQRDESDKPIVLMIGIDGLRADTLQRIDAPNLQSLANAGVFAKMQPAMPTKTFTNFYSLATGLHPKHHGMISNRPYDRELKRRFNPKSDQSDPLWWQGEPIWITAEKQGITTATYFWVGSEVAYNGLRPTFWKPYNQDKDYGERVEEVLQWLTLPKIQRPQLITLYFSSVDTAAHDFGVESAQEKEAVINLDKHLGDLLQGIAELQLQQQVNIIVVSDHGMVNLSDDKIINLDPYIELSAFEVPDWSKKQNAVYAPFLTLFGNQDKIDIAYQTLNQVHPNLQVLQRGAFPKNYHFDHPQRGPDLMLLADPGWSIYASRDGFKPKSIEVTGRAKATHGYDNQHPLMQAIFVGAGPAFQKNLMSKPFDNIEVYSLIACILDIKPAQTDGNITHVQHLLTKSCD